MVMQRSQQILYLPQQVTVFKGKWYEKKGEGDMLASQFFQHITHCPGNMREPVCMNRFLFFPVPVTAVAFAELLVLLSCQGQ